MDLEHQSVRTKWAIGREIVELGVEIARRRRDHDGDAAVRTIRDRVHSLHLERQHAPHP